MAKAYFTMQGDTWDAIAFKLWGKETYMGQLIKANPNYMDTLIFPASIELIVPDIVIPMQTMELPPWIQKA